ncbi:hypothetical protein KSF73_00880 [Burkholderiaceae bacterium DAT-1]|nr:hypothetical protein [Burkholderiaceae bacterium DAT-1]
MQIASSTSSLVPQTQLTTSTQPKSTGDRTQANPSDGSLSSIVALNQPLGDKLVYSLPSAAPVNGQALVYESAKATGLDDKLGANIKAGTLSDRFAGLGSAMLSALANGEDRLQQSVVRFTPNQRGTELDDSYKVSQQSVHASPAAKVGMSIQTRSGTRIELQISATDNALAISMSSEGSLTPEERQAVTKLSSAFQKAVDGMAQVPPQVDLSALTGFDTRVISNVDLNAHMNDGSGTVTDLRFSATVSYRTVNIQAGDGNVYLSIDPASAAMAGSLAQRQASVNSLLDQLTQMSQRSPAQSGLNNLFMQAFRDLQLGDASLEPQNGASATQATSQNEAIPDTVRQALSGLLDFQSNLQLTPASPNPLDSKEVDFFSLSFSQTTRISGNGSSLSISQQLQMSMEAAYHGAASDRTPMTLGTDRSGQNYGYVRLNDTASSAVRIDLSPGNTDATVHRSATRWTGSSFHEGGDIVSVNTRPEQASDTRSFNGLDGLQQVANAAMLLVNPGLLSNSKPVV